MAFEFLLASTLSKKRQRWKDVLWLCGILLALLALARPQWGEQWEETKRRGMDIMVVVDLSKSMLAGDISPSRLERARRKITDFVPLLQGDRIGLIGFAGQAYVFMPLTQDYGALPLFMETLSPESISSPGTALAQAIHLALQSFEKEAVASSQSIVLMSDGEDLEGDVEDAVKTARDKGIRIQVLGIGTPEGAPIPEPGGGFKKEESGRLILTRLDASTLETIARKTGGIYVSSVAGDDDVKLLAQSIRSKGTDKELKGGKERRFIDRYQWFLALAVLLFVLEVLLRETKRVAAILLMMLLLPGSLYAFGTIGQIREGEGLYQQGKYEEALQKFLDAEKKNPDDPRLQYNLGNTYHQLKQYDEATKAFSKIPPQNPSLQEKSLYNEGNNQYRKGALENAIKSYEEALKLDPKDEDAQYNLDFVKKMLEQKKEQEKQQQQQEQNQQDSQSQPSSSDNNKEGSRQQDQNQPSEQDQSGQDQKDQKSEGKNQEGQQDQPGSQSKTGEERAGKITRAEAERWLGGVREVRPRVDGVDGQKGGGRSEKDW